MSDLFDNIQTVVVDGRGPVEELAVWIQKVPGVWFLSQWGDFPDDRNW